MTFLPMNALLEVKKRKHMHFISLLNIINGLFCTGCWYREGTLDEICISFKNKMIAGIALLAIGAFLLVCIKLILRVIWIYI